MLRALLYAGLAWQMAQNPSPMTDQTREHKRLEKRSTPGKRTGRALQIGHPGASSPVILHFHGDSWLPEQSVAAIYPNATVIAINAGSGSDVYQEAVKTPEAFQALLSEMGAATGKRPVILTSFSAGYGAIRAILRHSFDRIDAILLMDSLHAGYEDKAVASADVDVFLTFAKAAVAGKKRMLVTHSEVFPGTFASTTETADWLVRELHLHRVPVLRWGPVGMQQTSEVRRGRFAILGFAGNSAPDHVDHLHGMSTWLRTLRKL